MTNQRREESRDHTNTLLSLVDSKSNVGGHCQVTCKAQYRPITLPLAHARGVNMIPVIAKLVQKLNAKPVLPLHSMVAPSVKLVAVNLKMVALLMEILPW